MENRNSGSDTYGIARRGNGRRMIAMIGATAALGLVLIGCASSSPSPAAAMEKTELHFSLDQCQPMEANLYKCPAVDKPVCSPDYNGSLDCVRIGPKGSVFVQRGIE